MSFNPKFSAFQSSYGFDGTVTSHWQMVPLHEEKKVFLENAEKLIIRVQNPSIVQISEITNSPETMFQKKRLFQLKGLAYGSTFVEVLDNNFVKTRLQVSIKKPKIISLGFNFLVGKDIATNKLVSDTPGWMRLLNNIYQPQTNINFIQRSVKQIKMDNLGAELDFRNAKLSTWEWDTMVSKGDKNADINLFFGRIVVEFTSPTEYSFSKGLTWEKNCFICDEPERGTNEIIVMAHEIGHALGLPSDKHLFNSKNRNKFIMFYHSKYVGKEFLKMHINTMNP